MDRPADKPGADSGLAVTVMGAALNLLLLVGKIIIGLIFGSLALVADGIHSASDLVTDLLVYGGIRLAARKADANHAYGHGRYETLAGGTVAAGLIAVGLYISWRGGIGIFRHEHYFPGPAVIVMAAVSVLTKEWLYRRTLRIARAVGSPALEANSWHHRTDALSSVAVLCGGVGGLLNWGHADEAAGMVVGLMVAAAGGKTLFDVSHELLEGSLCAKELADIDAGVRAMSDVKDAHQIRSRRVGRETFIDLHILVDPNLSLQEGHRISMKVEERVRELCRRTVNVLVHVEPDLPELAEHQRHEEE